MGLHFSQPSFPHPHSRAFNALPRTIGVASPGNSYLLSSSRTSSSTRSSSSGSSTMSTLFMNTTMYGTPTWRARRMCSRVWGIGPSAADTTRIAPSICAAPVIMFLMSLACLGSLVNLVEGPEIRQPAGGQHLRDRGRQRRLPVIHVADRTHVHVRLRALELLLGHVCVSLGNMECRPMMEPTSRIELLTSSLPRTRSAD